MPHTLAVLYSALTKLIGDDYVGDDYVAVCIFWFSPVTRDKNKHVMSD